jgi:exopolysaccharide biosynthesis WecB/TagA/CpsF family protein
MLKIMINKKSDKNLITFLNPYSYILARQNKELFENFNIKIDGILLVKILNLFGFKNVCRESFDMTSLAPIVFENAIKEKKSLYIIGTKPQIIDEAIKNIKNLYPELNIIGYRDGYFNNDEDRDKTLRKIKELNPDIVICGMGTPLQEKFLVDLKNMGWKGIGYTCGGFLHQTATNINYYPKWIDKLNLRWLYRIYDEPKLFKRYFFEYPKFIFWFIFDYIKYVRSAKLNSSSKKL